MRLPGRDRRAREPIDDLRAPGEADASRRAWSVTRAAFDERPQTRRRRFPARAVAVAAAAVALVAGIAFTPPGDAVADWVERTVGGEDPGEPRATGLADLPGGGRILVLAGAVPQDAPPADLPPVVGAPTIGGGGEPKKLLGDVLDASWSPRGRFVAAGRGSELIAVDRAGQRRWSVAAPGTVRAPSWSPSGYRVAYLAGARLRVVNGDGTGDRRVGPAAGVAPVWLPGNGHVLAFAPDARRIAVADLDRRRVLRRIRDVPRDLHILEASARGEQLLAVGYREARIYGARTGEILHTLPTRRSRNVAAAASPRDDTFAIVRASGQTAQVVLLDPGPDGVEERRLFAAGQLGRVAFSPDGSHVLVEWTETGSWLFLPTTDDGRTRQINDVAGKFGAEAVALRGWAP